MHRVALAGQGGLVDVQIVGDKQEGLGRDDVTGAQYHDLARHHILERDLRLDAAPDHVCVDLH